MPPGATPTPLLDRFTQQSAHHGARLAKAVKRTVRGLFVHHAFDAAAAMTFYFFLSLVPLLAFLGFVVGRVAVSEGLDAFVAPLFRVLPVNVATLVRDDLSRMGNGDAVGPLSLVGFVYLTSSGTHNLMDLLEVATGAPPRGWWRQRGIAVAWNAASIALLAGLAWIVLIIAHVSEISAVTRDAKSLFERVVRISISRAETIFLLGASLCLSTAALALFFRIAVRHPPGIQRRAWPGAIVAVTLAVLVSWAFGVYVSRLATYAVYYGSLAAVAVLLMWLYLTSLSLLVGAEINAQLEGLRPMNVSEKPPE